jgi:hypothetical protein
MSIRKNLVAGAVAAALLGASSIATNAGGVGPGAAAGIGLGAFALGTALGSGAYAAPAYGYGPGYAYGGGYPYGGYYAPAPVYAAPVYPAPRRCWYPELGGYYQC